MHTVPPRDAQAIVEEYLVEAHRLNLRALRIIHGPARQCHIFNGDRDIAHVQMEARAVPRGVGRPLHAIAPGAHGALQRAKNLNGMGPVGPRDKKLARALLRDPHLQSLQPQAEFHGHRARAGRAPAIRRC